MYLSARESDGAVLVAHVLGLLLSVGRPLGRISAVRKIKGINQPSEDIFFS